MKQTDTVVLEHYKRILNLPDPWQVESVDTDIGAKAMAGFIYCSEPIASALGALFHPQQLSRTDAVYANDTISLGMVGSFESRFFPFPVRCVRAYLQRG